MRHVPGLGLAAAGVALLAGATGCRPKPLADDEVFAICAKALECQPDLKKETPTQSDCASGIRSRIPARDAPCSDAATAYERCVLARSTCTHGKFEAPDCEIEYRAKVSCDPKLDARF